jgi:hypothetical protein
MSKKWANNEGEMGSFRTAALSDIASVPQMSQKEGTVEGGTFVIVM